MNDDPDIPTRILDYVADIWIALKGIGVELDAWNHQIRRGTISIHGVPSIMSQPETPIDIPTDNCPARVDWQDRLGATIAHDKTMTSWSAEGETGAPTAVVSIDPNLDADTDDETATIVFNQGSGLFRVVATTPGEGGTTVRAQSALYTIVAGAAAVGVITVG